MFRITLLPITLAAGLLSPAFSQQTPANIATICSQSCGPSADLTKAELQKCMQTCQSQGAACVARPAGTGTLFPKYYVLGLIYSPPGCSKTATQACAAESTVDYQSLSAMGTKVSTESSFSNGISVKADIGLTSSTGSSFGLSTSAGYTSTSTDSSSETISKSSTIDIKATGNADGINHDQDQFILLLNPAVVLKQGSYFNGPGSCGVGSLNWNMAVNTTLGLPNAAPYFLSVGELKNPASMPADVAAQLKALKFDTTDYQTILALDPFASGAAAIDPTRYVPTTTSFPYEYQAQPNCTSFSNSIKNEVATEMGNSYKTDYKVSITESLSGISVGAFKFGVSLTDSFDWTSSSTDTDTTDSSQTATAVIQCPSAAYNQPQTFITAYWDKLYGSFMFVADSLTAPGTTPLAQGSVTNAAGSVVPHQQVDLAVGGKTLHTYTNSLGKYVFLRPPGMQTAGTAQVSVLGTKQPITVGTTLNIKVASAPGK